MASVVRIPFFPLQAGPADIEVQESGIQRLAQHEFRLQGYIGATRGRMSRYHVQDRCGKGHHCSDCL